MTTELPRVDNLKVKNQKVLLRVDFDVPLAKKDNQLMVADETRLQLALKTIKYLVHHQAKVLIIAHLDRPEGKRVPELSLAPIAEKLAELLKGQAKVSFSPFTLGKKVKDQIRKLLPGEVLVLENLRFHPGEEKNDPQFTADLASFADVYVNEALAVSHRSHASIVGLPKLLPTAFGFNFLREYQVLHQTYLKPHRPVVVVLGGKKKDKILAGQILLGWVDMILVGGELVEYDGISEFAAHKKVRAHLTKKGEDITLHSAQEFANIIKKAGTVIWSGPMGAYENPRYLKGTEIIAKAIVASKAFSVVGGGNTEAALEKLGLVDKIDFVCSGGGAMLEFLAQRGTLPGIEAVRKKFN